MVATNGGRRRGGRVVRYATYAINAPCTIAEISSTGAARTDTATHHRALWLLGSRLFSQPMRFVARILVCALFVFCLPFLGGNMFGRTGALAGAGLGVLAVFWLWLWLPRSAHDAFEAGKYAAAQRRYRLLGMLAATVLRERSALLSRAGCFVASGNVGEAERLLATLDLTTLAAAERAVWLNNRACAALAAGEDPHAALALVDEASAIRPDVPALQHTRGMALLAVGRVDDAIAVLDGMRAGGELPPRLEAERCRDLARAWLQKGEAAYAEDYRLRAEALAR